jgi:hypothetical protein
VNSGKRIWQPEDSTLVRVPQVVAVGGTKSVAFSVYTPDTRIAVKVGIVFFQDSLPGGRPIPFDVTGGGLASWALSLQGADRTPTGVYVPHTNLLGAGQTQAQAQVIPLAISATAADNLNGFSLTVQDMQDAILGTLWVTTTPPGPLNITAALRVRYNATVDMCDDEWNDAKQAFSINSGTVVQVT